MVILNVACAAIVVILAYLAFQSSAIEQRIVACEQLVTEGGETVVLQGRTIRTFVQDANALAKVRRDGLLVAALFVMLVAARWQAGKRG
jgi:hypothetical protein